MTDDIVTLLRGDFCDFGQWENSCTPEGKCPCCLAADEIERLRKAIVDYVMTVSDCYSTPATDSDALELLKQAVRGE